MRDIKATALALSFLVLSGALLVSKNRILVQFSPQHTVDPDTVAAKFDPSATTGVFNNKPVQVPLSVVERIASAERRDSAVLGETASDRRIEIDLTNQRLYAYEGAKQVYNFLVSTGTWDRTPTGVFEIWVKLTADTMSGGSQELGTYYYLPNVPYVMYFYNDKTAKHIGYGIHGAYWHDNFGTPMSHGCINLRVEDAEKLFYWAKPDMQGKQTVFTTEESPGTKVYIYGKAPRA